MKMISSKTSFVNQHSIMIELSCYRSHQPQISSFVNIQLRVYMAHMQYYLRALQNGFSCKIFSISIQSLWVIMLKNKSGTNYILNKPGDVGQ